MEITISKRENVEMHTSPKKINIPNRPLRQMTLEEVLEKSPFLRKKHEDAVATLKKYPIPEEFRHKNKKK
ncbi:hypothetical protein [Chitinophaga filiformis]|uniref:Uncharacterized protein n=1 Tax=Chitinophaga filiformis TaxID=104663 RepID=A0ABY4HXU9_CHIFI|nr:hypothetical protein [Chitinophaga filiformis]UPK67859.1 hypothetical protein MYF79_23185 [Chitinophaga filiformis]